MRAFALEYDLARWDNWGPLEHLVTSVLETLEVISWQLGHKDGTPPPKPKRRPGMADETMAPVSPVETDHGRIVTFFGGRRRRKGHAHG